MAGVETVLQIPQGVAVIAGNTGTAMQACEALALTLEDGTGETRGTDELIAEFRALLNKPGNPAARAAMRQRNWPRRRRWWRP